MSQQGHANENFVWEDEILSAFGIDEFSNFTDVIKTAAVETGKDKGEDAEKVRKGKGKKEKGENGVRMEVGESSSHGMHILTERERRKKMRNLFSTLHSLVPNLPSRADKSTVLEEATKLIIVMQDTLQRHEKQKLEKLQGSKSSIPGSANSTVLEGTNKRTSCPHLPANIQTWASPNVVLNVSGDSAQFVVYAPKKPVLFANICSVLDKYKLEVIFTHISADANYCTYMIRAHLANGGSDELVEVLTMEEKYWLAAEEIMMLVSS